MDSLNLFEKKEIPKRERPRSLPLILAASALVPGLGHFLLGKKPTLYWLTGAQAVVQVLAALARLHLIPGLLYWPSVRAAFAISAFAIIDAGLLCVEMGDGRHRPFPVRARMVGFLSLTTYGGGFWAMERRLWAAAALIAGLVLHGLLGALHPLLRMLTEVIVGAFAVWTYRLAWRAQAAKPTRKIVEAAPRLRDSTPAWATPGALVVSALAVVGAIATGMVGSTLKAARAVRQEGAIAVEPYYRNPNYGVSLELGSPGWTFDEPRPEEFVVARHLAEDITVRLASHSRVPLLDSPQELAAQALEAARDAGYRLDVEGGAARRVAGLGAWELQASGTLEGEPRKVLLVAVVDRWQGYTLWFEWGEREQAFAQHEVEFVLSHVQFRSR